MNHTALKYFLLSFLLLALYNANAQNYNRQKAIPIIKNFAPEEYDAHEQNFDITQDNKGIMYFANFGGILKYDGNNWYKISTSSGMRVLDLDTDDSGRVYAAGLRDFGYLEQDDLSGSSHFVSLAKRLPNENKAFRVFGVHCAKDITYFVSEKNLYIYSNDSLQTINFTNTAQSSFFVKDNLYLFFKLLSENRKSNQNGLTVFENKEFTPLKERTESELIDVSLMFEIPQTNQLILGTSKQGFFSLENNVIVNIDAEVNEYVKFRSLICGTQVSNKFFALGTLTAGIVVTDYRGNIIQVINSKSKLQNDAVNAVYTDKSQSLWIASDYGISKIDLNSNWSYIDNETSVIDGHINKIGEFNSTVFVASDEGLFYLSENKFETNLELKSACHDFIVYDNNMLAATTKGVFLCSENRASKSAINEFTFCLTKSRQNPNTFYAGLTDKFYICNYNDNEIVVEDRILNVSGDIINIEECNDGKRIFLENSVGEIYNYEKQTQQVTKIKQDSNIIAMHILRLSNKTFLSSDDGLFDYNPKTNNLEKFVLIKGNKKISWLGDIMSLPDNNFVYTNGEHKELSIYLSKDNKILQAPFLPFRNFPVSSLYYDEINNNIWIGGTKTIIIFKAETEKEYKSIFKPQFAEIKDLNNDTLVEFFRDSSYLHKFKYSENSKEFYFTCSHYPSKGEVQYRSFLDGFDKDTTEWTSDTRRQFTNLPDKQYRLLIQARNEFGNIIGITEYNFEILTPLYRRWWAILIYIIVFIAIVKIIFDRRMRVAEKEKLALEKLVKERTAEIEKKKTEVEEQRDIAYKRRKEIIDSINYAQRIQRAVLPGEDAIDDILGEHFVFFKPYEIVSGDFFWMKKIRNFTAVVAADCTGHGVPGAFMSMLGSSFLNEIVTSKTLDSPGEILNNLRFKVKKSLHQEGKAQEQKDGMDISFYLFDSESYEVQFSGAYNPLYIIRHKDNFTSEEFEIIKKDESIKLFEHKPEEADAFIKNHNYDYLLIELKGNRQPIGIYIREKNFTSTTFQLKKGDTLYNFSDGYIDQFGGETGAKFKSKRFRQLLQSIQEKNMPEQKRILDQTFYRWKANQHQIDDVIIIGFRV